MSSLSPFDRLSQWLADGNLLAAEAFWLKREKGDKVPARIVEVAAKVAERDGRWEDALARWQRCSEIEPRHSRAPMGVARAFFHLHRWEEAQKVLQQLLTTAPDRLGAHELAARAATQLGQPDKAQAHWKAVAEDDRFARQASLALMQIHERAGDTELAAQQAMALLNEQGLPVPVLKTMLRLTRATDRWVAAARVVEMLQALEPSNPQHRLAQAQCLIALREVEAARELLGSVEALPINLATWQVARQVVRGQADEAFLTAHAARLLLPESAPEADADTGPQSLPTFQQVILLLQLAADARVATLQHLVTRVPSREGPQVLSAMLTLALAAALQQPLNLHRQSGLSPAAEGLLGLFTASLQQQAGECQLALATLDGSALAPLALAWGGEACQRQVQAVRHDCWLRLGDWRAASDDLDAALAVGLDRDWAAVRALTLRLYGLGQIDSAAKWVGEAEMQQWRRPLARQLHALVLCGTGQATKAVAQLQARLDARPDDDDARVVLARVLQSAGDPTGALATLNPLWLRAGLHPLTYADAHQLLLPAGVCAVGKDLPPAGGSLVSIVMTLPAAHAHLVPCLRSVLAQTWTHLELILLVTDMSGDQRDHLILSLGQDARVHMVDLPPGVCVARAWNLALAQARGDCLWFSDADAWWHPDALSTQMAALSAKPHWLACRHSSLRVDAAGRLQFQPERPLQPDGLGATLLRRELFDRLGGFDEVPRGYRAEWLQRLVRTLGLARLGDLPVPLRLTCQPDDPVAGGADLPAHWYGQDVAVDQYLHAARRWLNDAASSSPVLDSAAAGRPFPISQDV